MMQIEHDRLVGHRGCVEIKISLIIVSISLFVTIIPLLNPLSKSSVRPITTNIYPVNHTTTATHQPYRLTALTASHPPV